MYFNHLGSYVFIYLPRSFGPSLLSCHRDPVLGVLRSLRLSSLPDPLFSRLDVFLFGSSSQSSGSFHPRVSFLTTNHYNFCCCSRSLCLILHKKSTCSYFDTTLNSLTKVSRGNPSPQSKVTQLLDN